MKRILFICALLWMPSAFSQDSLLLSHYEDSTTYKLVIRTENLVNGNYIALDNLTARINGDTTTVYYMNYGNGLVSSVMIPYSIFEVMEQFESKIAEIECKSTDCLYSILFEIGSSKKRYPIDILETESLSSLMLELEN